MHCNAHSISTALEDSECRLLTRRQGRKEEREEGGSMEQAAILMNLSQLSRAVEQHDRNECIKERKIQKVSVLIKHLSK